MARAVEFDEAQAVQKAMHVFWHKGYKATSMRDLTEAMQINASSLYNTLGDKRQLFIKALKHYTRSREVAFKRYDPAAASPFGTLAAFIEDAVHSLTTETSSCMCVRTAFELEGDDPEIQAVIQAYDEFTCQFLKRLLEGAQAQGEISVRADAATMAEYLNSAFAGWYNAFLMHRDQKKIQDIAAFTLQQLRG